MLKTVQLQGRFQLNESFKCVFAAVSTFEPRLLASPGQARWRSPAWIAVKAAPRLHVSVSQRGGRCSEMEADVVSATFLSDLLRTGASGGCRDCREHLAAAAATDPRASSL